MINRKCLIINEEDEKERDNVVVEKGNRAVEEDGNRKWESLEITETSSDFCCLCTNPIRQSKRNRMPRGVNDMKYSDSSTVNNLFTQQYRPSESNRENERYPQESVKEDSECDSMVDRKIGIKDSKMSRLKAVMIISVDQIGIAHAPHGQARALLLEHDCR